jgi:hypothetical protein
VCIIHRVTQTGWLVACLVVLGACGRIGFDPVDASDNPLAGGLWLEMEEAVPVSGQIRDTAGDHGVRCLNGACPTSSPGRHGRGFTFLRGEQLQIDWEPGLDGRLHGYTVAAWAHLDVSPAQGDYACAFAEPNDASNPTAGDGNSYALCVDGDDVAYVFTTADQMDHCDTLTDGTREPVAGGWHHLAATWDPGSSTKALYVDGGRVASCVISAAPRFDQRVLAVGADLRVSAGVPAPAYPWRGTLDDVRFFARPLDDNTIAALAAP